jgi:hypothetical protein
MQQGYRWELYAFRLILDRGTTENTPRYGAQLHIILSLWELSLPYTFFFAKIKTNSNEKTWKIP